MLFRSWIDLDTAVVIAKHSAWPVPITDELHATQVQGFRDLAALLAG